MWNIFNRGLRLLRLLTSFRALSKTQDPQQQQRAHRAIMQQFADAKGVTMKVGQLLAASAADDGYTPLVTSIDPIPLKKILPHISTSLGQPWQQVFSAIDESEAAASLGQVHHARLKSGEEVALKIQYPDIAAAIDAEMKLLGLMPKAGPVKKWHFDLDGYRHELRENMQHELDYRHEAQTQQRFFEAIKLPGIVIPRVFPEYGKEKVLVQSWEEGVYLSHTTNWPEKDRINIARQLLGLLLKSLFESRLLHGDPHMGNSLYRYRDNGETEVVLMDYGCAIELEEQQSLALLKLILSVREKTSGLPLNNFVAMGFDAEKLEKIEAYLPRLCLYLFAPFIDDDIFILRNWKPAEQIENLLGDLRWWFRSAGPARLIFIMRAFQGMVQQLQMLNVDINWWQVLVDVLPESLLQQARDYQCPVARKVTKLEFEPLASTLKVKITDTGVTKAEINLPAEAVLELEAFIPDEIKLKLEQTEKIDLASIIEKVKASSLAAQVVFDYGDGRRHYRVWLE